MPRRNGRGPITASPAPLATVNISVSGDDLPDRPQTAKGFTQVTIGGPLDGLTLNLGKVAAVGPLDYVIQGGSAIVVRRIDVCALGEKQSGQLIVCVQTHCHQSCAAVRVLRVDICTLGE